MTIASAGDYREAARRRLPEFLFEYIDGGSYDEVTLRRNVEDLQALALRQRVLRDVSSLDLSTELFGERLEMPLVLAPVGLGAFKYQSFSPGNGNGMKTVRNDDYWRARTASPVKTCPTSTAPTSSSPSTRTAARTRCARARST